MPEEILKIGVGHLFATGNRPGHDEIFHIAGMRYSGEDAPEEEDWIINPGRNPTRRLYEQSQISKEILKDKPAWEKAEPGIAPFFTDLDILFLHDRGNQKEWFRKILFKDEPQPKGPVIVDLLEMTRFFLPDHEFPDDKTLIEKGAPGGEWKRSDPRLPYLVRGLGEVLQSIVSRIRDESEAIPGHCLIYSLLKKAITGKPPREFWDFYAVFKVAGMAHQVRWGKDLFAQPYGDKALGSIQNAEAWQDFLTRRIVTTIPKPTTVPPKLEQEKLGEIADILNVSTDILKKHLDDHASTLKNDEKVALEDEESYLKRLKTHIAAKRKRAITDTWQDFLTQEAIQGNGFVPSPEQTDAEPSPPAVPIVSIQRVNEAFNWLVKETEGFKSRPDHQQRFARFCTTAINKGGMYAIEAGTGTGKTLGYLIPASEYIRQGHTMEAQGYRAGKIIIATATKNLQDQLLETEWPRLTRTRSLYQDFKAAPLKGKNNFLCTTAVVDLFEEAHRPPRPTQQQKRLERTEKRLTWLFLFLILIRNRGETTENIPRSFFRQRFPDLEDWLDEANAEETCPSERCSMGTCIYPQHLRKAREADIVVTNHSKLPSMDSQIQEIAQVCLIDEADQFPDNLRKATAIKLSSQDIRRHFLQRIKGSERRRGFAQILKDRFTKMKDTGKYAIYDDALKAMQSILADCNKIQICLDNISKILRDSGKFRNSFDDKRWINTIGSLDINNIQEQLRVMAKHFDRIVEHWNLLLKSRLYEDPGSKQEKKEKARIEQYIQSANKFSKNSYEISMDYSSYDFIHTCSFGNKGWILKKIPYNISNVMEEKCCEHYPAIIFTSATLFVDNNGEDLYFFMENLGTSFDKDKHEFIQSPFDYSKNVRGFVTTSIPDYPKRNFKQQNSIFEQKIITWRKEVASAVARLTVALNGRTLVLFTNTEEMENIYKKVDPILEEYGIASLLQDGSSLAEINTFLASEHSVLFGVSRFWTGVDFPGRTLSQVIMVRLPNPRWRGDSLIDHRRDYMGDEFEKRYYHPAAKLRLRQGFGRLIRKETDKGLFVVLDRRLWSDVKMHDLQNALPVELQQRSTEPDKMNWLIDEGLTHLGLRSEFKDRKVDLEEISL